MNVTTRTSGRVDPSIVRDLLKRAGVNTSDGDIRPIPGGTINAGFAVQQGPKDALIVRIAPSDAEADAGPQWLNSHGLRRELAAFDMLPALEPLLPHTVHADFSREHIDRDWVVQSLVPGRPWADVRSVLSEEEDIQLWSQLGEVTRTIHGAIGSHFGPPEEGCGFTTWSGQLRWDVTGFLVDAQRFGFDIEPFQQLCDLVDHSANVLDEITDPQLVHSDLNLRHVFVQRHVNGAMAISGLIDFEFARFADPYSESVFTEYGLRPSDDGRDVVFCNAYGCDRPDREHRLRDLIYEMRALAWIVTDLVRLGRSSEISTYVAMMQSRHDEAAEMA